MTYEENIERVKKIADTKGLHLNTDNERIKKVIGLMTENYNSFGAQYCPCKQINDIPELGKDPVCPCPEMDEEIKENGCCRCRVFYK